MRIRLSSHAAVVSIERKIEPVWIARVVDAPEWTEPDPLDRALTRAFGPIQEAEGRVLRVVYADRAGERLIVTYTSIAMRELAGLVHEGTFRS